jgi:Tol biopolymer transport system component
VTETNLEQNSSIAWPSLSQLRPTRGQLTLFAASLLLLAAALLFRFGRPTIERWSSALQPLPVGGQLLLPAFRGIEIYNLSDRSQTLLVPVAAGETITAASWSPDRSQIAYSLFHRRPGDPTMAMEIYLAGADGSSPRPLAERNRPGEILDAPVWSPDGRDIYFAFLGQLPSGRYGQRIERVQVETGQRTIVLENAYAPALSPDGRTLLFLRDDRMGIGLWLQPVAGGDPSPVLRPDRGYTLGIPRFSPDGTRVAVSLPISAVATNPPPALLAWLLPPPAYAHGEPADIWSFDLQGNNARRLTHVNGDEPTPGWSPDGRYIASWGGTGLHLVDTASGETRQLLDQGGYGPIDWRP